MTVQSDNNLSPKEIQVSGDGTVPYWNLGYCRKWAGKRRGCEVTVNEIEGVGHGTTRYHLASIQSATTK